MPRPCPRAILFLMSAASDRQASDSHYATLGAPASVPAMAFVSKTGRLAGRDAGIPRAACRQTQSGAAASARQRGQGQMRRNPQPFSFDQTSFGLLG